jgi:hypothetical protein
MHAGVEENMHRTKWGSVIAVCLLGAGLAASNGDVIVTNPTPAVSATMGLSASGSCFDWNVHGKVKPAYRGHGASVKLVCQPYSTLGTNVLVFGAGCGNDEFCPPNVDACGNFSFNIITCGSSPQLDNSYVCNFIVHVDDTQAPQACSDKSFPPDGTPGDPNGSAPCAGGFCPSAP